MRILIDTNRYVDLAAGDRESLLKVEQSEEVFLPFIVLAELRAGFLGGTRPNENEEKLTRFLNEAGVMILYADDNTTRHYAVLYQQLRKQGTPIPTNDIWIAALVIQHDLILFARDKHFEKIPQLARI
jgi:tRNA(fMet)-specific endonuclease VapC